MNEKKRNVVNEKRIILGEAVPLAAPLLIYMDVCNLCNFRCKFCAAQMMKLDGYKRQLMSLELYKKIIDDIAGFPTPLKTLRFVGGGEPLINKELPEMIAYAKEKNVAEYMEVVSNGSLLTQEMSDGLSSSGLNRLRLSIEAIDAKGYKEICGADIDWEKFLFNIKYFYEHRGNCEVYVKIVDTAVKTQKEKELFYQLFTDISDRLFIESVAPVWANYEEIHDKFDMASGLYGQTVRKVKICPFPFYSFQINSDGEVTACCSDWKRGIILGNARDENVCEIWKGEKYRSFLKGMIEKGRIANHSTCAACEYPDYNKIDDLDAYGDKLFDRF